MISFFYLLVYVNSLGNSTSQGTRNDSSTYCCHIQPKKRFFNSFMNLILYKSYLCIPTFNSLPCSHQYILYQLTHFICRKSLAKPQRTKSLHITSIIHASKKPNPNLTSSPKYQNSTACVWKKPRKLCSERQNLDN